MVGVVSDVRETNVSDTPGPECFFRCCKAVLVRFTSSCARLPTRTLLPRQSPAKSGPVFPDQPVTHLTTMSRTISESVGDQRLRSVLLVVFAAIGFALALLGVYGVISYSVARRVQEIGIRMALGAAQRDILGNHLRQGLLSVAIGRSH